MVMGMSAPPTRMANATPKKPLKTRHSSVIGVTATSTVISTMVTAVTTSEPMVSSACRFHTTGFWPIRPCSFAAATRLPVSVSMPTATARPAVALENAPATLG